MKRIDLEMIALGKLWSDYYNKVLMDEETKDAIRNGEKTIHNDCAEIGYKDFTKKSFSPEVQAKIDKYIEENHFEKVVETKENYSIEIRPTAKARKKFIKMIEQLADSNDTAIKRVASKVKNATK